MELASVEVAAFFSLLWAFFSLFLSESLRLLAYIIFMIFVHKSLALLGEIVGLSLARINAVDTVLIPFISRRPL